ncbi:MAG: hypothetical protein ACR2OD_11290, partial [Gaiellaceae bacterium]
LQATDALEEESSADAAAPAEDASAGEDFEPSAAADAAAEPAPAPAAAPAPAEEPAEPAEDPALPPAELEAPEPATPESEPSEEAQPAEPPAAEPPVGGGSGPLARLAGPADEIVALLEAAEINALVAEDGAVEIAEADVDTVLALLADRAEGEVIVRARLEP